MPEQVKKNKKNKSPQANKAKAKQRYGRLASGNRSQFEGSTARVALQHSKYLNSIIDPANEPGAKIPDEITAPSYTAQTVTKIVLPVLAGTSGGSTTYGVGLEYLVGAATASASQKYNTLAPTTSAATYAATAGAGTWAPGAQLSAAAQSARPVSCGMYVSVQGSPNTIQGRMLVGFLPPTDPLIGNMSAGNSVSVAGVAAATYVVDVPVPKAFARAVYVPLDDIARSYLVTGTSTYNTQRPAAFQYGALFALLDGFQNPATYGVNVEFTIIENWELIPASNQLNITQPEASHSDPLEMAAASNVISSIPTLPVLQSPADTIVGAPQVGMRATAKDHPSFIDKVFAGFEKGFGIAKKVAPIAAQLLAVL